MKRFQFRLQRLLDVSRRSEEVLRRKAATTLGQLKDAELALKECLDLHDAADQELCSRLAERRLDAPAIRLHQDYSASLLERSRVLRGRVMNAEAQYSAAQRELAEKRREILTLERTRDTAVLDWRADVEREESSALDETASRRWLLSERT